MEAKRLAEWLDTADGLFKTITASIVSVVALAATVTGQLKPIFGWFGLPDMAGPIATVSTFVAAGFLLWRDYHRFARESRLERPEKFTLVATTPESLIGRVDDLDSLLHSVKQNRVVLLDGESGCGKSALIASGLVPRLQASDGLLPILVRDWGDDWIRGPLAATLDALYGALTAEQRARIEWSVAPDLAAKPPALAAELTKRLSAVNERLQRRSLLIADQFDDYQAQHRDKFLDVDGNWLTPSELSDRNPFWILISERLLEGNAHLLAVTRSDTSSGLSCIRFLDNEMTAVRQLPKVGVEYLHPLLVSIAPDQAIPPIVSNPENGWHALRDRLEIDFRARGAILMQQVRAVLLGLRQLPTLTPRAYRRAEGMSGVETLVVARALRSAAEVLAVGQTGLRAARAILNSLVLPGGTDQIPKAARRTFSELVEVAGTTDQFAVAKALRIFQTDEIARPAWSDALEGAWQLDHDYLAGSVLAEKRDRSVLEAVQPSVIGLMDGSASTLAPVFTAAFATHNTWTAFLIGFAASIGAGSFMGFAEALADDRKLLRRGSPLLRGSMMGLMTTAGGLVHTLPFLIPNFYTATVIAACVVMVELTTISWVQWRYMEVPPLSAAAKAMLAGALALAAAILIGSS